MFAELNFNDRLREAQSRKESILCVGLDPDVDRLPRHLLRGNSEAEAVLQFNRTIIASTHPYACAFKLNLAFYEVLGRRGFEVLQKTRHMIPADCLTIADAKRGDIGNTARKYAQAIFEQLNFDACTIAPYMGRDAALPFLEYPGKAVFILVRTSNYSSIEFQSWPVEGVPFYELVARHAVRWNMDMPGTIGMVVGGTHTEAPAHLRAKFPTVPFLIPGIGAQGGSMQAATQAATIKGRILVNSSRNILYQASGANFATRASQVAMETQHRLNQLLTPYQP
ncbi:MAG: orotidine-5'-phosphate decarboxylase [Bacteroidota bacterium]|nr:orotidine-5'-phosphate decarboxylase [Bacteroidota bacterium]MDE2833941.1 orotidine-5'-phosphate decarboxylase [Bacteroidota bacterium]MDE2958269.1 orotidine-5'-phosphate decarboxylase [Bacteroidota bacterium]